jgi:hypothetical protein
VESDGKPAALVLLGGDELRREAPPLGIAVVRLASEAILAKGGTVPQASLGEPVTAPLEEQEGDGEGCRDPEGPDGGDRCAGGAGVSR